jgi:hypothetical protein
MQAEPQATTAPSTAESPQIVTKQTVAERESSADEVIDVPVPEQTAFEEVKAPEPTELRSKTPEGFEEGDILSEDNIIDDDAHSDESDEEAASEKPYIKSNLKNWYNKRYMGGISILFRIQEEEWFGILSCHLSNCNSI